MEAGRHHRPVLDEIDCAEIYVPFSWFEPMWLENLGFAEEGDGLEAHRGRRHRARRRPPGQHVRRRALVQPDRRLRDDPLRRGGAPGAWAAGEHQVDGARKALGHAYGGGSQFFAMWVVGADKPSSWAQGSTFEPTVFKISGGGTTGG